MRRIAVLLAGVLFSAFAVPASAHVDLVSMTPQPGSIVSEPLDSVVLTFGEDVQTLGSVVVVIDPNGNDLPTSMIVQGPTVTLTIGEATSSFGITGVYHVNYRVNSADGHIVEGSEVFTYDGPVPSSTPVAIATLTGGDDGEAENGEEGGGMIGLGLLAIIVIGGIAYAVSMRNKD